MGEVCYQGECHASHDDGPWQQILLEDLPLNYAFQMLLLSIWKRSQGNKT